MIKRYVDFDLMKILSNHIKQCITLKLIQSSVMSNFKKYILYMLRGKFFYLIFLSDLCLNAIYTVYIINLKLMYIAIILLSWINSVFQFSSEKSTSMELLWLLRVNTMYCNHSVWLFSFMNVMSNVVLT